MTTRIIVSILFYILSSAYALSNNEILITNNEDLHALSNKHNITYVISIHLDLKDSVITLAPYSTLRFIDEGLISNGSIVGDNSRIEAKETQIFNNIKLYGIWDNSNVYGVWFDTPSNMSPCNSYFNNLMTLSKGDRMTHLYTALDTLYVEAINGAGAIRIPSNLYWHNQSIIYQLPCSFEKFSTIHLDNVHDVTIDGGMIIGDVKSHMGNSGEWGHGIKCSGAKDIIIKNISCNNCWGDGIDLIEGKYVKNKTGLNTCERIIIDKVKCNYNRRQGMSIEAATDVVVCNSEFCFTGAIKATLPTAGIDIEPWANNSDKIYNIKIENCRFIDNGRFDISFQTNLWRNDIQTYDSKTLLTNCSLKNCEFKYAGGVNVDKCVIDSLVIHNSSNISFSDCSILHYTQGINAVNVNFNNCRITKKTKASDISSLSIICLGGTLIAFIIGYIRTLKT